MHNSKRFLLGVLSSLLFAVGLTRAAESVEPVTQTLRGNALSLVESAAGCAEDCSQDCNFA